MVSRDRDLRPGLRLKGYLLAYAVFRFALESVRGSPVVLAGLTGSQLFLVLPTVLLAVHLARQRRAVPGGVPA